jgi:alkanesulfonate monooxygenase
MPGMKESNEVRYARASEIIQILQGLWRTDGPFEWKGEFYRSACPTPNPRSPTSKTVARSCTSAAFRPPRRTSVRKHCDVFLMWPETEDRIAETMRGMSEKPPPTVADRLRLPFARHRPRNRSRGPRRRRPSHLKLDAAKGAEIKARSQDSQSARV